MIAALEVWHWRIVSRVKWIERKTSEQVTTKLGVSEEQGLLKEVKRVTLSKYRHWKSRGESYVLATIQEQTAGIERKGKTKT